MSNRIKLFGTAVILASIITQTPIKPRECLLMIATGLKGVGKTWATIHYLLANYVNPPASSGKSPRKVLVFDVNDEYGEFGIKAIDPAHIPLFVKHPKVEIRRIRPFRIINGKAKRMSIDDLCKMLEFVLENFAGGLLLVEDLNKIVSDSMPKDLVGIICTNRHINCDIILHYQSIGRPLPKIWQNTNIVRFHHQNDDVMKSKSKLTNPELFKIAQELVSYEFLNGNERFYAFVNMDRQRIVGDFTAVHLANAIRRYLKSSHGHHHVRQKEKERDDRGKKMYHYQQALEICTAELFRKYWGNTPL